MKRWFSWFKHKSAFEKLGAAVTSDPDYAWAIHCNIAMPIMDELHCTHEQANLAAARILHHWWKIDITKHRHWIPPELQYMPDCQSTSGVTDAT